MKRFVTLKCKYCEKEFTREYNRRHRLFCSRSCTTTWRNLFTDFAINAGKASAAKTVKRSKNEIYFYDLCKDILPKTSHNYPLFKGWDADIIIENLKIVVFWNGKWHYEKINKKHSIKQVQNRDKIKTEIIQDLGFEVYVIKDLGKYSPKFVEDEFNKFLIYLTKRYIAG